MVEGLDGWNNERPPPVPGVRSIPHLHALGAPARPSHGAAGRGVGAGGWGSGSGSGPGSGPLRASAPRARPGMRRRRVRPSREPPASARAGASPLSRRGRARARRGRPQRSRRGGRPAIAPPAAPPSARGPALGAPAGRSAGPLGLAGDAAGGLERPPTRRSRSRRGERQSPCGAGADSRPSWRPLPAAAALLPRALRLADAVSPELGPRPANPAPRFPCGRPRYSRLRRRSCGFPAAALDRAAARVCACVLARPAPPAAPRGSRRPAEHARWRRWLCWSAECTSWRPGPA